MWALLTCRPFTVFLSQQQVRAASLAAGVPEAAPSPRLSLPQQLQEPRGGLKLLPAQPGGKSNVGFARLAGLSLSLSPAERSRGWRRARGGSRAPGSLLAAFSQFFALQSVLFTWCLEK